MAANPYIDLLRSSADKHGLDLDLVRSLATQENQTYDPDAVSDKGAVGLMQIMPDTAGDPGYGQEAYPQEVPLASPPENVDFGVGRLKAMLNRYDGVLDHALAAYNMGPGATNAWIAEGSNPSKLPKETRNFITEIKSRYEGLTEGRVAAPEQPPLYEVPPTDTPKERRTADNLWGREGKPTAAKESLAALKMAQPKTRREAEDSPSGSDWWTDQAEWAGKALYSGVADLGALIVDVADLGFVDDGLTDRFADYIRQHTEDVRESIPEWIKKDLHKEIVTRDENGEWDLNMPNVRQVANLIFESAAPSGAIVGIGAKGFKLLQGISKTKALGQAVTKNPRLAAGTAYGTANSAYVTAETYTSVYGDVLEEARKTMSLKKAHEEAAKSATFAAAIMAPLSFVTGGLGEGLAATGKTFTKRLAKGLVGGSITEFPEEGGQSIAEQLGRGEDVDLAEAVNAGVLGMLGAGVTEGAMAAAFGQDVNADIPSPTPEAEAGARDVEAGLPPLPPPAPGGVPEQQEFDFGDQDGRPEGPSGPPSPTPTLFSDTATGQVEPGTEADPAQQSFLTPVTGRVTAAARRAAAAGADSTADTETPDQPSTRDVHPPVVTAAEGEPEIFDAAPEPAPEPEPEPWSHLPDPTLERARQGNVQPLRRRLRSQGQLEQVADLTDDQLLDMAERAELEFDALVGGQTYTVRERDIAIIDRVTEAARQQIARRAAELEYVPLPSTAEQLEHDDEIAVGLREENGDMTGRESARRTMALRRQVTNELYNRDLGAFSRDVRRSMTEAAHGYDTTFHAQSYENALEAADTALQRLGVADDVRAEILDAADGHIARQVRERVEELQQDEGVPAPAEPIEAELELAEPQAETPEEQEELRVLNATTTALMDELGGTHMDEHGRRTGRDARVRHPEDVATRIRQEALRMVAIDNVPLAVAMHNATRQVLFDDGVATDHINAVANAVQDAGGLGRSRPDEEVADGEAVAAVRAHEQRFAEMEAQRIAEETARREAGDKFLGRVSAAAGREVTQAELDTVADMGGNYEMGLSMNSSAARVARRLNESRGLAYPPARATINFTDEAEAEAAAKVTADLLQAKEELERGAFTLTNIEGTSRSGVFVNEDVQAAAAAEHQRRGEPTPEYSESDVQEYRSEWKLEPSVEGGGIASTFNLDMPIGSMRYDVLGPIAYVHAVSPMAEFIPRQRGHGHKPILQAMEQMVERDLVVYADDQVSRFASRVAGVARQQGYDIELNEDTTHDAREMDYGAFRSRHWAFRMASLPEGGQMSLVPESRRDTDHSLALLEANQPVTAAERPEWMPELARQRDARTNRTVAIRMTPRQGEALSSLIEREELMLRLMRDMSPGFREALDARLEANENEMILSIEEALADPAVEKTYADYKLAGLSSLMAMAEVAEGRRSQLVNFPVSMWADFNQMLTDPSIPPPATDKRVLKNVQKRLAPLMPSYVAGGPLTQMGAGMRGEPRPDTETRYQSQSDAAAAAAAQRARDKEAQGAGQMFLNLSGTQDPITGREPSFNETAQLESQEATMEQHTHRYNRPTEGPVAENTDMPSDEEAINRAAGTAEAEAAALDTAIRDNTSPDATPSSEHQARVEEYLHGQVGAAESDAYWQGRDAANEGGGRGGGGRGGWFRNSDTFKWFRKRWRRFKQAHWDQWVRDAQDAQIAIERVQRVLIDNNGLLADKVNLHEAWTRLPAAVVDRINKMEQSHLAPLMNVAAGKNPDGVANQNWEPINNETVNKFIAALHSVPRNYFIAKRNSEPAPANNEAGGSGVSVNAALATLAEIEANYSTEQLAALEDQVYQMATLLRDVMGVRTADNTEGTGLVGDQTMAKWKPDEDFKAAYNHVRDTMGYAAALDFTNYSTVTNPDGSTMTHEQWQDNLHKVTYVPLFDVSPEHTLSKLLHDVQWARDDFSSEASIFGNEMQEAHGRSPDRGLAQDALSHMIVNMQTAITRGQRNRTLARRTINLIKALNPSNTDNRIGFVLPEAEAGSYADGAFLKRQIELHRPSGEGVSPTQFPPGYTPPIVRYKKGDTEVAAIIYDIRLAEALMTRSSEESQSRVVKAFLGLSSLTRRAMTTLSPGFIGVNIFREGINARIQTMSIPGIPRDALKEIAKTINPKTVAQWSKEYYQDTKNPNANVHDATINGEPNPDYIADDTQRYHREIIRYLKEAGMPSLLFKSFDPRDIKADMQKSLDAVTQAGTPAGTLKAFGKAFGKLAQFSEDVANATENGVRAQVAAGVYKHFMGVAHADMLAQHPESAEWTQERKDAWLKGHHNAAMNHAANAGQNLSVNFQRFGKKTRGLNRLFFFLNATIQGSTRVFKQGGAKRLGMLGARLGGYGAASTLMNYLIAGEDDEGRNLYEMNVPQWVREHNMVVMIPFSDGQYVAIPLPYGFNFFWGSGEAAMSAMLTAEDRNMTKGEAFAELPGRMLDLAMNSFTPVPSQAKANPLRLIAPSMMEPWVDLAQNKDWRGIPIVPPGASYLTTDAPPPDAFNVRDPDPDGSLEYVTRTASRWMNKFFGGNEYKAAGFGDVNPNTIEHLVKSYTGGAGMLAFRTIDAVGLAASGETGEAARSAPVVRRFYGLGESRYDDRDRYNKLRTELLRVDGERKGLIAAGDSAGMKNFLHTDGDLYSSGVVGSLKRTENQVRKWARMRNKIRRIPDKTQAQKDRLEALDDRITQLMVNFNTYYYDKLVEEDF